METLNLNDSAAIATIASTLMGAIFFTIKFRRQKNNKVKSESKKIENQINRSGNQLNIKNDGNLTINGSIAPQIISSSATTPDSLARPRLRMKQIGFSNGGIPHRTSFKFQVKNMGGDCFNLCLSYQGEKIVELSKLSRDEISNRPIILDLPNRPRLIEIKTECLDQNGNSVELISTASLSDTTYIFDVI
jgi:hypothetical protein